jgi:HAD superfamily hydrolase (TIGR01490 family)
MGTRGAAFFDLDRTLIAGSSAMDFVRASRRAGLVGRRDLVRWGIEHLIFRLRGSTDESTKKALRAAEQMLRGVPERNLARMAPEILAGILPRIYPEVLAEAHRHQDEGRATFIVSAAGNEMVKLLADVLGMDGGIGTRYEVDETGVLTGRLDGPLMYREGKVAAIENYAREHDLDLSDSWAYSDSESDLPMLRAVGHAVVVNPDPELSVIAAQEGWHVMRFERLGRRLAIAGGLTAATVLAAAGMGVASRLRGAAGAAQVAASHE